MPTLSQLCAAQGNPVAMLIGDFPGLPFGYRLWIAGDSILLLVIEHSDPEGHWTEILELPPAALHATNDDELTDALATCAPDSGVAIAVNRFAQLVTYFPELF